MEFKLSPAEIKDLIERLRQNLTAPTDLDQVLQLDCEKQLSDFEGGALKDQIFNVVTKANTGGWVGQLIRGVSKRHDRARDSMLDFCLELIGKPHAKPADRNPPAHAGVAETNPLAQEKLTHSETPTQTKPANPNPPAQVESTVPNSPADRLENANSKLTIGSVAKLACVTLLLVLVFCLGRGFPPSADFPVPLLFSPVTSGERPSSPNTWKGLCAEVSKKLEERNPQTSTFKKTSLEVIKGPYSSSGEQINAMKSGTVQICALGTGASVSVLTDKKLNFRPIIEICNGETGEPLTYNAVFITSPKKEKVNKIKTVRELMDELKKDSNLTFRFGDEYSNSGYRVPFITLSHFKVDPTRYLEASNGSQNHSTLLVDVAGGNLDAACVASDQLSTEFKGRVNELCWSKDSLVPGVDLDANFPTTCIFIRNDLPILLQLYIEQAIAGYTWKDSELSFVFRNISPENKSFVVSRNFLERWTPVLKIKEIFDQEHTAYQKSH